MSTEKKSNTATADSGNWKKLVFVIRPYLLFVYIRCKIVFSSLNDHIKDTFILKHSPDTKVHYKRNSKEIKYCLRKTNIFASHIFGLSFCVHLWFHSAAPVRFGPGGTDPSDGSISPVTYTLEKLEHFCLISSYMNWYLYGA